jgi:hypothetical protein
MHSSLGYQLKGLVRNNSKKKTTSLLIQYGELLNLKTQFEAKMLKQIELKFCIHIQAWNFGELRFL